jgi:hypothetical protein
MRVRTELLWTAGEAKPPWQALPIDVEMVARVFRVTEIDDTAETFKCTLSLKAEWIDLYYKHDDPNVTPQRFSTQPHVSMNAENFPAKAESLQGLVVLCDSKPRFAVSRANSTESPPERQTHLFHMRPRCIPGGGLRSRSSTTTASKTRR